MTRIYNFSAGPSTFPQEVLEQASSELLEWHEKGLSVLEMTHRGKDFVGIAQKAEADLRDLLGIPSHYKVLFLQGGATTQFAAVPLNLLGAKGRAAYVLTGIWAEKAIREAEKYGEIDVVASSEAESFTVIPDLSGVRLDERTAYFHYTSNETIGGLEFQSIPEIKDVPLVTDASSNILSRSLEVNRFGLIYAGAQKNLGPAGITVVIVREDLLGRARPETPTLLDYSVQAKNESMLNTPPTYSWYLLGLVLEWLKKQGGVAAIETRNIRKAKKLYDYIDASPFYVSPVDPRFRSRMNVPFRLGNDALEKSFIEEAKDAGLINLEGHRSVGGLRASIYNAQPEAAVDALINFLKYFEGVHAA